MQKIRHLNIYNVVFFYWSTGMLKLYHNGLFMNSSTNACDVFCKLYPNYLFPCTKPTHCSFLSVFHDVLSCETCNYFMCLINPSTVTLTNYKWAS